MTDAMTVSYAGFWKRLGAIIIDTILVGVVAGILGGILGGNQTNGINFILGAAYFILMEGSDKQATLGKMALGIKVTDLQGRRVSYGRAAGRHFAKIISGIILGIGFLMAAFTAKKQALHDIIAETLVVNAK